LNRHARIEPGVLCLDCGMCCTGAVFTHLDLTGPDKDRLHGAGLGDAATQHRLDFPCRFLDGARCSIYASRPAVCASYRCKTLAQAQDGMIDLSEAKDRLHKVVELRRAFEAQIPPGMAIKDAIVVAAREPSTEWELPKNHLELKLAFVALQAIIDRYLRADGDGIVRQRGD